MGPLYSTVEVLFKLEEEVSQQINGGRISREQRKGKALRWESTWPVWVTERRQVYLWIGSKKTPIT